MSEALERAKHLRGPLGPPALGGDKAQRPGKARRLGGRSRPALCACRRKGKGRPLRRRRDTPSFPSAPDAHTSSVCANASRALQGPSNGAPSPFAVPFGPLRWRPLTTARPVPPRLSTARRPWQGPLAAAAAAGYAALAPSSGRAGWSGWASPRSAPPPMAGPPSACRRRSSPAQVPVPGCPRLRCRFAPRRGGFRSGLRAVAPGVVGAPPAVLRPGFLPLNSCALRPPAPSSSASRPGFPPPSRAWGLPRAPSGCAVLRPPGAPTPCRRFGLPIVAPCQGRLRRRPWRSRLGKRALWGARQPPLNP